MPNIIIPRGHARDGWIWTSVNGNVQWIKTGELTTIDSSHAEVLTNAMIPFETITTGGDIPAGSIAHFSFAQGVYWTQADGNLTAPDIIDSTASIVAGVGYTGEDTTVQLIGPALSAISRDMTMVLRGRVITTDTSTFASTGFELVSVADSADFNSGAGFGAQYGWDSDLQVVQYSNGWANVYDTSQAYVELAAAQVEGTSEPEARIDTAYSLTATELSLSTMGADTVTQAITISFAVGYLQLPRADSLAGGNIHIALESITVYPAQDDSALPALSTPL